MVSCIVRYSRRSWIYRDGDNNLDRIQSPVIDQAFATSEHDPLVAFNVEDFTARAQLPRPEAAYPK